VVVATEAFRKLLAVALRARRVPDALAIVLKGNPEYLEPAALDALADKLLREAVRRLTTGSGEGAALLE